MNSTPASADSSVIYDSVHRLFLGGTFSLLEIHLDYGSSLTEEPSYVLESEGHGELFRFSAFFQHLHAYSSSLGMQYEDGTLLSFR